MQLARKLKVTTDARNRIVRTFASALKLFEAMTVNAGPYGFAASWRATATHVGCLPLGPGSDHRTCDGNRCEASSAALQWSGRKELCPSFAHRGPSFPRSLVTLVPV